jgi:hypothetical protein
MGAAETVAQSGPDWEAIGHAVECPLCRYNLRGLSEPRCPECGYAFEWREILDTTQRKHRYLFEHHPERNVWSFFMTLAGGLVPWRFWRTLHPAQPADEARLTAYRWVVKGIACLPMAVAGFWLLMMSLDWQVNDWPRQRLGDLIDIFPRQKSTMASELIMPLLRMRLYNFVLLVTLFLLALPEMSSSALLIYRSSMRRAKLERHHVDRCVAYSYDVVVWPISFLLMLGALAVVWPFRRLSWEIELLCWSVFLLLPAVWAVMSVRLACSYRYYLRMRHAVAAVVAGQVIVALFMMVVMVVIKEIVAAG